MNSSLTVRNDLRVFGELTLQGVDIRFTDDKGNNHVYIEGHASFVGVRIYGADWVDVRGGSLDWMQGELQAGKMHSDGDATLVISNVTLQLTGKTDVDESVGEAAVNAAGGAWTISNGTFPSSGSGAGIHASAGSVVRLIGPNVGLEFTAGPGQVQLANWLSISIQDAMGGALSGAVESRSLAGDLDSSGNLQAGQTLLAVVHTTYSGGMLTPDVMHEVRVQGRQLPMPYAMTSGTRSVELTSVA